MKTSVKIGWKAGKWKPKTPKIDPPKRVHRTRRAKRLFK